MATSVEKKPIRLSRNIPASPCSEFWVDCGAEIRWDGVPAPGGGPPFPTELRHASTTNLRATSGLYPRDCGCAPGGATARPTRRVGRGDTSPALRSPEGCRARWRLAGYLTVEMGLR